MAQAQALEKQTGSPSGASAAAGPVRAGKAAEQTAADAGDWLVREKPDVKLADVAGLGEVKEQILII